jgi:hypothetical protein
MYAGVFQETGIVGIVCWHGIPFQYAIFRSEELCAVFHHHSEAIELNLLAYSSKHPVALVRFVTQAFRNKGMHVGYDIGCSLKTSGEGKKKHDRRLEKTKFERIR